MLGGRFAISFETGLVTTERLAMAHLLWTCQAVLPRTAKMAEFRELLHATGILGLKKRRKGRKRKQTSLKFITNPAPTWSGVATAHLNHNAARRLSSLI